MDIMDTIGPTDALGTIGPMDALDGGGSDYLGAIILFWFVTLRIK